MRRRRPEGPSTELLDGITGFLAAFALGLSLLIGWTILRGTQTPGPSLVLAAIVLGIVVVWRRRQAVHRDYWSRTEDE